jgi:hypothetical protein
MSVGPRARALPRPEARIRPAHKFTPACAPAPRTRHAQPIAISLDATQRLARRMDPLWSRPYRWLHARASGDAWAGARLVERWGRRPNLAIMDAAVDPVPCERAAVPRLRATVYLVLDERAVAGDAICGVFAGPSRNGALELVLDAGRALISCRPGDGSAAMARAVGRWLAQSACLHAMQPEDAALHAEEVALALQRILAQLDMVAAAMVPGPDGRTRGVAHRQVDAGRGARWLIGTTRGHARRRAYHDRELWVARARGAAWADALTRGTIPGPCGP